MHTDSPAAEVMEQFTRDTSVIAKCSNNNRVINRLSIIMPVSYLLLIVSHSAIAATSPKYEFSREIAKVLLSAGIACSALYSVSPAY